MLKVSVVVPVYNSEKYIDRCIESLLHQSYSNIEIILVNDGSTDNSLNILKEYKRLDKRIKVLSQKNGGAGSARNKGIRHASGDFLTFLDSDDCFSQYAIENMMSVVDNDTDIVIGGVRVYSIDKRIICKNIPCNNAWSEFKYTATAFKLYRKSFLDKNNILFNSYYCNEDLMFCLTAYSMSENIKICSTDDYINYKNSDSVTASMKHNNKIFNVLPVLQNIRDNINLKKYSDKQIQFFYIKTIVQNILMQLANGDSKAINKMYLENYEWLNDQQIGTKKLRVHWQKGETFSINFIVNAFIVSKKLNMSYMLIRLLKKIKIWRKV